MSEVETMVEATKGDLDKRLSFEAITVGDRVAFSFRPAAGCKPAWVMGLLTGIGQESKPGLEVDGTFYLIAGINLETIRS
ncbi:MAG: hypothetical protein WCV50_00670 [Patescibacteria group bacterium]|jgi:hypothetical protein